MNHQSGISLSEVLVSLFLSSLIGSMLCHFYLLNKRQYTQMHATLARGFEVQMVSDLLADSIRRAGFTPCLCVDKTKIVDRRAEGAVVLGLRIASPPHSFIQVSRMSEHFSHVLAIKNQQQVLISKSSQVMEGHPVLIADCSHGEIHSPLHVAQRVDGTLVTLAKPLMFHYASLTYFGEWLEEQWFIKPNAEGDLTLHYKLVHTEELSPLIHSLDVFKEGAMVDVHLGVDKSPAHHLAVRVRAS